MQSPTLGFIGTGKITSAVAEGFSTCANPPARIIVSPRNEQKAKRLADKFSIVNIAESNQDVVNQSDWIFLALRPETVEEALTPLKFRSQQRIISMIPTKPVAVISKLVHPAERISRAVPLPSVAKGEGPILFFSKDDQARMLLSQVGELFNVPEESQFHTLWAMTGMVSPVFALMDMFHQWAESKGVGSNLSRNYTAAFFEILARMAMHHPETTFSDLAHDAATPGGLNEQAVQFIHEKGGYDLFEQALTAVKARFLDP